MLITVQPLLCVHFQQQNVMEFDLSVEKQTYTITVAEQYKVNKLTISTTSLLAPAAKSNSTISV